MYQESYTRPINKSDLIYVKELHNLMKLICTKVLPTTCILACLCSACNSRKSPAIDVMSHTVVAPDTSIYARLAHHNTDSLVFMTEDGSNRIACAYSEAATNGQIYGSLSEGDLFSLLLSPGTRNARHIVNLTNISGQWFYDGENGRGFELGIDGQLSPINNGKLAFRKWKIYNGHLIFYYTDEQTVAKGEEKFSNDTTDIMELSPEKLVFTFLGKTYHCQRQHESIKMHFNF